MVVNEIKSQDDLNKQRRDSEVLISAIDELKKTKKQLEIAVELLEKFAVDGWYDNEVSHCSVKALNKIKELDK